MDQQSTPKQDFFQKSPEISFADSPALSLFKSWNNNLLRGNEGLSLSKKFSNGSILKPSPCISSMMPTPMQDPIGFLNKTPVNWLQDTKPLRSIKLEFMPLGSPEINFVLGPSAIEYKKKQTVVTKSVFDRHTSVSPDEKIAIKHIQAGGPIIYVTKKRADRIAKRRKKRVAFLIENPEYSLPYKFRTKGPKHQSRSKSAKNRKRKGDGRFATARSHLVDFTISMDDIELSKNGEGEGHDDITRNKL